MTMHAQDRPTSTGASSRRPAWKWSLFLISAPLIGVGRDGAAGEPTTGEAPRAQVAVVPHESSSAAKRVAAAADPIAQAQGMMEECQRRYDAIRDYTCTFSKRERFDGVLSELNVMKMKARTHPLSFYIKCDSPRSGREAIWIKGKHDGKVVAHDAGFFKVLAGTMYLDPKGSIAMEDNHHPITEAGLGNLIATLCERWKVELRPGMTQVEIRQHMKVGDRDCTMIETTHPRRDGDVVFHRVRVFIDVAHGVPIRLEGYDWPKRPGGAPELVEEYSFAHLRTNLGLTDRDFDPANPAYAYGRF